MLRVCSTAGGVACFFRYIMIIKVSDPTGEAWLSLFNDQAERIVGCSADELDRIREEEGDYTFRLKLKEATWVLHLFRVSVVQNEYMGEKRQRIAVRSESPVDFGAEARYQLEEVANSPPARRFKSITDLLNEIAKLTAC